SMTWEARRKILLEMCGETTDADVYSFRPELADLKLFLVKPGTADQFFSPDEYRQIATAERKQINDKLTLLPGRIDEATRSIPAELPDRVVLKVDSERLKKKIDELITQKANIKANDAGLTEKTKQIAELNLKISEARTKHNQDQNEKNEKIRERIKGLTVRKDTLNAQIDVKVKEIRVADIVEDLVSRKKQLEAEYKLISDGAWNTAAETCHACGQSIQKERIEAAKAAFNLEKSSKLEAISKKIASTCSDKIIQSARDNLTGLNSEKIALEEKVISINSDIKEFSQKIIDVKFQDTDEYKNLTAQVSAIVLANDEERIAKLTEEIDLKVKAEETTRQDVLNKLAICDLADQQKKRIEELGTEQKRLAREYEQIEKGLYLCEQFVATKMSLLTGKINDKFESVKFRMFEPQINGGINDRMCEVMIPAPGGAMVPYALANNAARINAGLEIISTLSEFWGISFPVFVDNAEAVTQLRTVKTQLIRLIVSETDKKLRLEVKN
ncbi:MAG: hypothetical protein WC998_08525, partial [Candidatus Paceibacterota bacterium]